MTSLRIEPVAGAARNFIDVTDVSREAGFACAVAVSMTVYRNYVALPRMGPPIAFSDMQRQVRDRLWNVLSACRDAIAAERSGRLYQIVFNVYARSSGPYALSRRYETVRLTAYTHDSGDVVLIDTVDSAVPAGRGARRARKPRPTAATHAQPSPVRVLSFPLLHGPSSDETITQDAGESR